jgi:hypothetical protein
MAMTDEICFFCASDDAPAAWGVAPTVAHAFRLQQRVRAACKRMQRLALRWAADLHGQGDRAVPKGRRQEQAMEPQLKEESTDKPTGRSDPPPLTSTPLCWPFPLSSQNHTDKAVKLKPYEPPKRRSLNQF